MRLLYCHNTYAVTSGEDMVFAQDVEILQRHGDTVALYQRDNQETQRYGLWRRLAFPFAALYSRRTARELRALVRRERPDAALVQNVFPLLSPAVYHVLDAERVPIVQLVYNYRLVCPNAVLFSRGALCERCLRGAYHHAVLRRCYRESRALSALYAAILALHAGRRGGLRRRIDAYVTPDRFLADKLAAGGYPADRMFPVHNPFDPSRYAPHYACVANRLVYFGRIVREKGIFTLLQAVGPRADWSLVVVGGGEAEPEARRLVAARGWAHVRFTGPQYGDDLVAVLRDAAAVIVPTEWYDNAPLVVDQAFALGKPVVASRIDGIPEVVEDGVHGWLVPAGDPGALRDRIADLLADEPRRETMGRAARRRAEMDFTPERRYAGLMTAIREAIARRRKI